MGIQLRHPNSQPDTVSLYPEFVTVFAQIYDGDIATAPTDSSGPVKYANPLSETPTEAKQAQGVIVGARRRGPVPTNRAFKRGIHDI